MTKSKCQNKFHFFCLCVWATARKPVSVTSVGYVNNTNNVADRRNGNRNPNRLTKYFSFVICALCLFWILCFGIWNYPLYAEDKIIAIVNSDVITQKDLNDFISFMSLQLSKDYSGRELENRLQSMKQDLLDKLIEDRLILQEAKRLNINIDDSRVKAKINEIKKRYPSDDEYKNDLLKQGITQADLESKLKEQLFMYEVIEQMARSKVIIRPDEVTSFYNQNIREFVSAEERQLESITVENEDLAKTVSFELKSGKKLVDLAARFPLTVNKLTAKQGELRKDIENAVFKLNISEVSEPFPVNNKYYIFILEGITAARQLSLSESQDKIYAFLFGRKIQEKLTKLLDELKAKSYIRIF